MSLRWGTHSGLRALLPRAQSWLDPWVAQFMNHEYSIKHMIVSNSEDYLALGIISVDHRPFTRALSLSNHMSKTVEFADSRVMTISQRNQAHQLLLVPSPNSLILLSYFDALLACNFKVFMCLIWALGRTSVLGLELTQNPVRRAIFCISSLAKQRYKRRLRICGDTGVTHSLRQVHTAWIPDSQGRVELQAWPGV